MEHDAISPRNRPRRLTRSRRERMWAGVSGGLAEYFDIDPVPVRLLWVIAAIVTGGLAIPVYIALWIIMPRDDRAGAHHLSEGWREVSDDRPAADEPVGADEPLVPPPYAEPVAEVGPRREGDRQRAAGVILIGLGLLFLAGEADLFDWVNWSLMWPLVLVGLGVALLMKQDAWRR